MSQCFIVSGHFLRLGGLWLHNTTICCFHTYSTLLLLFVCITSGLAQLNTYTRKKLETASLALSKETKSASSQLHSSVIKMSSHQLICTKTLYKSVKFFRLYLRVFPKMSNYLCLLNEKYKIIKKIKDGQLDI